MPKCPSCTGPNELQPYVASFRRPDGTLGSKAGYAKCSTCGGKGWITAEHQDAITMGSLLRRNRISRGISLREHAQTLGCSPSDLSQIEVGYINSGNSELAKELWASLEPRCATEADLRSKLADANEQIIQLTAELTELRKGLSL